MADFAAVPEFMVGGARVPCLDALLSEVEVTLGVTETRRWGGFLFSLPFKGEDWAVPFKKDGAGVVAAEERDATLGTFFEKLVGPIGRSSDHTEGLALPNR